ncbi:MAG: allantoate amidohydrolase [Hyphomicrobiales bacterium]|nr:allantoate amidohydrolase [Hyphomicrobiales bacterium]
MNDPLNGATLMRRIDELARASSSSDVLTRLTLTPAHRLAADMVAGWMREAGMSVRVDRIGNVVGRLEGPGAQDGTLLVGSHIDTVRDAGRFDGNLGVVLGIAAVADLVRRQRALPFAVEVIAFSDEEGVRFPTTLTGSKAIAGTLDPQCLADVDADGVSRAKALSDFGAPDGDAALEARDPARILGYVEAHIEQGPVLEDRGLALGVVTAINGATRAEIQLHGMAGHAGTLPMHMRRDALAAAAEMILAIEARAKGEADLVATVGLLTVPSGAVNVVPGEVRFTLDLRSPVDAARAAALADVEARMRAIAADRNVALSLRITYDAPATPCDAKLQEQLAASMAHCGASPFRLPSGAGHDALAFRGLWPVAMLFVRCAGGISHNSAEYASPQDMEVAARVLTHFIETLATAG